jgi:hypothetical protein
MGCYVQAHIGRGQQGYLAQAPGLVGPQISSYLIKNDEK